MDRSKATTIDEYVQGFPADVRGILQEIRQTIQQAAPEATEAISYAIPTFKLNGSNLVHFAAFKNHIGFYPTPTGIDAFEKDLAKYKQGKGSVQFPLDQKMPLSLISKTVKYNISRIQEKAKNRKPGK
jgi:uncharacterized protein YdhG (YjbR/CyaY superfamily)